MLSRKPTAIKLTHEDIREFDNFITQQKEAGSPGTSNQPQNPPKDKDGAPSRNACERQQAMDARIGIATGEARVPRR